MTRTLIKHVYFHLSSTMKHAQLASHLQDSEAIVSEQELRCSQERWGSELLLYLVRPKVDEELLEKSFDFWRKLGLNVDFDLKSDFLLDCFTHKMNIIPRVSLLLSFHSVTLSAPGRVHIWSRTVLFNHLFTYWCWFTTVKRLKQLIYFLGFNCYTMEKYKMHGPVCRWNNIEQ